MKLFFKIIFRIIGYACLYFQFCPKGHSLYMRNFKYNFKI